MPLCMGIVRNIRGSDLSLLTNICLNAVNGVPEDDIKREINKIIQNNIYSLQDHLDLVVFLLKVTKQDL
jgi:hypothetical protein